MSKKEENVKKETVSNADAILDKLLKDNRKYHLNFEEEVPILVSTGSLKLDLTLGGGLNGGAHRFVGPRESGKTSCSLAVAKNFQKLPNSKVIYVKAEGRLSKVMQERSGLDWSQVRVIESNIYEFIIKTIRTLIHPENNTTKTKFLFIIDSVDGLMSESDMKSADGDAESGGSQKGKGAALLSDMFRQISLALNKLGHMAIFISQERAKIEINKYAPKGQKQGSTSGGNAIQHYVNYALEFEGATKTGLDLDANDKPVGRTVIVNILKSGNEETYTEVSYPIRYKQPPGKAIWVAKEIVEICLQFGLLKQGGAWISWNEEDETVKEEILSKFPNIEKKMQGITSAVEAIEKNQELLDFLYAYVLKLHS